MSHEHPPTDRRATENATDQHVNEEPKAPTTGIPPLPEPDVEGVGEESGPSAGTDTETLDRDQKKLARDGTGF